MTDFIPLASGLLDDPFVLEWAIRRYRKTPKTQVESRQHMETEWFHDLTLTRWLEQGDPPILSALFRELPPARFENLQPQLLRRWAGWPPNIASAAAPILARLAPDALLDLYAAELRRVEQGNIPLNIERFLSMVALDFSANPSQFADLADRLARVVLRLQAGDIGKTVLAGYLPSLAALLPRDRLAALLEAALTGEPREFVRENVIKRLFKAWFGGSEYLDLVLARGRQQSTQRLDNLPALFESDAPLAELNTWLDAPPKLAALLPLLEALGNRSAGCAAVIGLMGRDGVLGRILKPPFIEQIALAACLHGYARTHLDTGALDLPTTLDLLAADLDVNPWREDLLRRLRQLADDDTATRLIARLIDSGNSYGAVTLAWVMGRLGWEEFTDALLASLGEDSGDFLCEAARDALIAIGPAAQARLMAQWSDLDRCQQIFGLSAIQVIGGSGATEFALSHFDTLMTEDLESCCELTLASPDRRLLARLAPQLRRRHELIDWAYYLTAKILGQDGPDVAAAGERLRTAEDTRARRMAALERGSFETDSLTLELRCPKCGDVNRYAVKSVIHPGTTQPAGQLPLLVADELPCASCDTYVEFEFTPQASMGLMAEVILNQTAADSAQPPPPKIRTMDCQLDGEVVPMVLALQRLQERAVANPDDTHLNIKLGLVLSTINRPRAAIRNLQVAIRSYPKALDVILLLARLHLQVEEPQAAFDLLSQSLAAPGEWLRLTTSEASSQAFAELYNDLRRQLLKTDVPALHPAVLEPPAKVGRNDPCPCGSGKKYKKCCLQ